MLSSYVDLQNSTQWSDSVETCKGCLLFMYRQHRHSQCLIQHASKYVQAAALCQYNSHHANLNRARSQTRGSLNP